MSQKTLAYGQHKPLERKKMRFLSSIMLACDPRKPLDRKDLLEDYRKKMDALAKADKITRRYERSEDSDATAIACKQLNVAKDSVVISFSNKAAQIRKCIPDEFDISVADGHPPAIAILDRNGTRALKTTGIIARLLIWGGVAAMAIPPLLPSIATRLGISELIGQAWMKPDWMNQCGGPDVAIGTGAAAVLIGGAVQFVHHAIASRLKRRERLLQGIIDARESKLAEAGAFLSRKEQLALAEAGAPEAQITPPAAVNEKKA
jgi:hypothetical protein